MAKHLPLRGAYWDAYPVPECEARCFARRTLHEAFGGSPELAVPDAPRRINWRWASMCAVMVCAVGLLLAHGMHQ